MSQSNIARFPRSNAARRDNNPHAAEAARTRIAELPETYLAHAVPAAQLASGKKAISPAAVASGATSEGTEMIVDADAVGPEEPTPPQQPSDKTETGYRLPSRLKPLIVGAVTFVLLFLVFKSPIFLSQLNYLLHPQPTASAPATQASTTIPPEPTISIPKISVNAPVVYATDNNENDILADLQSGVVHYAGTALPGEVGNSVIFGHSSNDWWEPGNYKFVFVLLDKLQPGDTFSVNYNSKQYIYKVTSSEVVAPTDVAVLNPTSDAEMTLITCTPPGTSWKRLIVHSVQISPTPGSSAATNPATTQAKGSGTLPSNSPGLLDQLKSWWTSVQKLFGNNGSSSSGGGPTTKDSAGVNSGTSTIPATQ